MIDKNIYDSMTDEEFIEFVRNKYQGVNSNEGLIIQRFLKIYDKLNRDELTGLYNRKAIINYFWNYLNSDNNKYKSNLFSLVTIDLDHFKSINDTYGHNVGDDALKIVSEGMIRYFRKKDLIVRDGGDEFLIVTLNCPIAILNYKTKEMSDYITNSIHKDLDSKIDEYGNFINRPHDYTISYGIKEMDLNNLEYCSTFDKFKDVFPDWFKEEKGYADNDAFEMKQSHHAVRK